MTHQHRFEPWRGEGCFEPDCPDDAPRGGVVTGTDQPRAWDLPAEPGADAVPTLPPALAEAAEWFMAQYTNRVSPAALLAMAFIEGYAAGRAAPITDATETARNTQTGDDHGQ